MKNLLFYFLFFYSIINVAAQNFSKQNYYYVLSTNDRASIDEQLKILNNLNIVEKQAYEGTLMMRKAGVVGKPMEKLNLFKEGGKKLEAAIKTNENNTEFNFLRLMIQENSPKFLGYYKNIESDKNLILKNYQQLEPAVQQAIKGYSKNSKVLHTHDF